MPADGRVFEAVRKRRIFRTAINGTAQLEMCVPWDIGLPRAYYTITLNNPQ